MIQLIFVLLVITHSFINDRTRKYRLKKKDYRDIHKPTEIIKYTVASIIVSIFGYFYYEFAIWELVALTLFTRLVFFDISFNLFTGRRLDYENVNGTSLFDRIENGGEFKILGRTFYFPGLPFIHRQLIYTGLWIILILSSAM